MPIAGEFVLQDPMMTKEIFFRAAEYLPTAKKMLMITEHFACTPVPFKMLYEIWSTQPYNSKDSAGALKCAKTGLLVPVHAQATYNGKVYDRKWVPQGPRQ